MCVSYLNHYDFLKVLNQEDKEEFEVTFEAISCYSKHFSIYSKEKGWEPKRYSPHRNQMSSSGCWLQNSKEKTIDIAGDILTAVSAFSGLEKICPELHTLFERVYHTIGNCIPWPEGGNLGGRPWANGGSPDNYYRKLMACKDIITQRKKYDTTCVSCKIEKNKTLGRSGYASIQYWIDEIWKEKKWEDFVRINYLQDMVDENLNPRPFGLEGKIINQENLKEVYWDNIKMIICRGYRITHNGDLDSDIIKEIFENLIGKMCGCKIVVTDK